MLSLLLVAMKCSPETTNGGSSETSYSSENSEFLALKTVPILDSEGWGQPVVASTVLLPEDWQTQGGFYWNTSTLCLSDFVNRRFVAQSPDGSAAFEMLPASRWQWGQSQLIQTEIQFRGCTVAPPIDPNGALEQYVIPSFRPGARVRDITPSPQAADGLREEYYRVWGPLFQMQNASVNSGAVRATLEYSLNGQTYEDWILLSVGEIITPSVAGNYFSYSIDFIYSLRAPSGTLSQYEQLFSAIVSSVRINPAWESAIVQLVANVNTNISQQAGNRAAIWQNAMNQVGQIRMQTWQQSQETVSRVSNSWSRALRGVDSYIDPVSQQSVELPTGYRNAWGDGSGAYVLSPDPSFNPNSAFDRGDWQRMELTD
jgi:hypothetical protein